MKTPTLNEAKAFLRIDGNADDALVQALLAGAKQYVLRLTGKSSIDGDDVKAAVLLVLAGFWDRREAFEDGSHQLTLNPILDMILRSARVDYTV